MQNINYLKIEKENTFSKVTKIINEYKKSHPDKKVISLGIGDVSRPLVKPVIEAMHKAVDDMSSMDTFQGYGLYHGLKELREVICENEYKKYGFSYEEIYIGDGTKSDCGNVLELFDQNSKILVQKPVYPIYINSCRFLSKDVDVVKTNDDYKLEVPDKKYDVIFLCTPCNPTGNAYTYDELTKWVEYANKNKSVLIVDNVYEAFIESEDVPHSIYEIDGAKTCAIELRSFSKVASFSGTRCSYFVLPKELGLNETWNERCINRFNGASYIAQKGAIATYSNEAQKTIKQNIKDYKENTRYLKEELGKLGFEVIGGVDSPYLWIKTKGNINGFEYLKFLLEELQIVMIPGEVFDGPNHMRVSGLGSFENSKIAIQRLKEYYEK